MKGILLMKRWILVLLFVTLTYGYIIGHGKIVKKHQYNNPSPSSSFSLRYLYNSARFEDIHGRTDMGATTTTSSSSQSFNRVVNNKNLGRNTNQFQYPHWIDKTH